MLDKQELKERRRQFYELLTSRLKSSTGKLRQKSNWLNYPLGLKETYFRCEFDRRRACICIDLQHRDLEIRQLFWLQWLELKAVMNAHFETEVMWEEEHVLIETGKTSSRIVVASQALNFFEDADWDQAFAFFEHNLSAFDSFWKEFKDAFQGLL